ncbi:spermatogenesis associated 6-like protein isoform X2 [Brienomyrus brachyistius]|uniref:spermatogenesis associated 6-like protein isoform X2 n=1 Tax=Brienomyrus brachyistius TaxID=42636 RepID=UPI0020B2414C|nr:spermatogenesis associated 6-like protein isoform X2 [Brienomyrus brachyistius]
MSQNAVRVVIDLHLRSVTCPGVFLAQKDDLYLSVCLMNQYKKTECHSPVFPIVFQERMRFDKVFKHVHDPADVSELLECERVKIELIQLIPPVGELLAHFEADARSFLFPEPKLVPPSSGVDRDVLMTRSPVFPGIAPRLEFSTRTSIRECPSTAENNFYPNILLRAAAGKPKGRKCPLLRGRSPPRLGSLGARRGPPRGCVGFRPRSLSLGAHGVLERSQQDTQTQCHLALPGGLCRDDSQLKEYYASCQRPLNGQHSASPNHQSADQGNGNQSHSFSWDTVEYDSSSSRDLYEHVLRNTKRSPEGWDEVHQRVRGLLTTSRALHRLTCGATDLEVDEVLARRSISPCRL